MHDVLAASKTKLQVVAMGMAEREPTGSRVLVALRVPATAEEAFRVFTEQIGEWWHPNGLFTFSRGLSGRLAFEDGPNGRLVERYDDGSTFTIGNVRRWNPPYELVVSWRQESFGPDQETELHVTFTRIADRLTRVTVEHFGWDTIPAEHVARHGFPLAAFQQRHAEWWQALLASFADTLPSIRPQ